jgi:thiamine biosynthesis lipoprotein
VTEATVEQVAGAAVAQWRAIGTYVHVGVADPAALEQARLLAVEVLEEVDRTCSRFRQDSDLTRANAEAGRWVDVHPLLAAATQAALDAAAETDGLVDPCLGRVIISLGYDRTFGQITEREPDAWTPSLETPRAEAWRELGVDMDGRLRVPAGVSLDLGATAKAWASDLVALTIFEELGVDTLVSLGGDIRVVQSGESGWPVQITERPDDEDGELILLCEGGLATSTTRVRRWTTRGGEFHHLLDPRTGRPTQGPWRTVTAIAPTALESNVLTTASLVLGTGALDWLAERGATARLIDQQGTARTTGSWPAATTKEI